LFLCLSLFCYCVSVCTLSSHPSCFSVRSGGNEESEMYELHTAREWSDDDEGGDGDPDDDDEGLTFSYIAIAEAEAVGASRLLRDRRRAGSRGSRTPLIRTDTLETLLDSPDADWDPQLFLGRDEEEETSESREHERVETRTESAGERREREQQRQTETITIQPQNLDPEPQERDEGVQREESVDESVENSPSILSSLQQSPSQILQSEKYVMRLLHSVLCETLKYVVSEKSQDASVQR
uniref:Uncharacterized protein n=1 Tax=Pundamilia nyererei TaxID=303518 RepID=A0A3B4GUH8_9CICH